MADNVGTVAAIYEAFGRGDVPAILEYLADDVEWDQDVRDTGLPYLKPRRVKAEVAGFFTDLMATVELTHFEPQALCDGGDTVAVPVIHAGRVRGGGEVPPLQEVHIWRFGPDGKVTSFRHIFDYAVHEQAAASRTAALTGRTLRVIGDTLEVKRAGGALEIFVLTGPVESGPPPHAHPWDEAYIGISGEVAVTIGDTTNTVGPGDTITVPAGTLHSFRIMSDTASFHVITSGHRASAFFADVDAQHPQVPTQESLPGLFDVAKRHALTSPLFT